MPDGIFDWRGTFFGSNIGMVVLESKLYYLKNDVSTCYKCGKETNGEAECPTCSGSSQQITVNHIIHQMPVQPPQSGLVEIDWEKVKTFSDLKFIVSNLCFAVERGSPIYYNLRKYLKE